MKTFLVILIPIIFLLVAWLKARFKEYTKEEDRLAREKEIEVQRYQTELDLAKRQKQEIELELERRTLDDIGETDLC